MRSVKSIAAAESLLRRLAGEDSTIDIRVHHYVKTISGRPITNQQWRVSVETSDLISVDSLQKTTLNACVQHVWQIIVRERVRRATHRRRVPSRLSSSEVRPCGF